VILERRGDHVLLVIEDDGIGFDRAEKPTGQDRGIGLVGMQERAALIGGTLEIETAPGGGTTVFVQVPTRVN
jgi:signal transduction histidine kinase